jgi:hypothetical protein
MKNLKTKISFIVILSLTVSGYSYSTELNNKTIKIISTEEAASEKGSIEPKSSESINSYSTNPSEFGSSGLHQESERGKTNRTNPCNLDIPPNWCN